MFSQPKIPSSCELLAVAVALIAVAGGSRSWWAFLGSLSSAGSQVGASLTSSLPVAPQSRIAYRQRAKNRGPLRLVVRRGTDGHLPTESQSPCSEEESVATFGHHLMGYGAARQRR